MYNLLTPAFSWTRQGTALQRLQNGLELGLSISKPTASARSAEILEAINKMELTFPMLTSEGAEGRRRSADFGSLASRRPGALLVEPCIY